MTFQDKLEIKDLLVRERHYRDSCQWQKLRNAYHPDASKTSINITWFSGDADGFVSGSEKMSSGGVSAIHAMQPIDVEINGSRAFSESAGSITIRFVQGSVEYDCTALCRFLSRLEKVEGEWKLLTLECIYIRDNIVPTTPQKGGGSDFVMTGSAVTRKSYRCLGWLLTSQGFPVGNGMPGVDDPETVKAVMGKHRKWLEAA
ncbi:hypothetical protein F5884DRAFT_178646 [Xylogone sp. PMI_703]|nr:hypothetical protein F5884DRAFT_178646 [Xylogone sp. PMI_703]